MQRQVFDVIGLSAQEATPSQFGFPLEAFKYGPPPHGGIAFGWDRIMTLLARKDTIRDAIAFPKAASGLDPLTGAPTSSRRLCSAARRASTPLLPSPARSHPRRSSPRPADAGRPRWPRGVEIRAARAYCFR